MTGVLHDDAFSILSLGGIVGNSDYGERPHCFDTCHLFNGSLQRPSSPIFGSSNQSDDLPSPVEKFLEDLVTTPPCFEIKPLSPSLSEQTNRSSEIFLDELFSPNTSNTSLSASARTLTSSYSSWILTFIFLLQMKFI